MQQRHFGGQMLYCCIDALENLCISLVVISQLFRQSVVVVFLLGYSRVCEASPLSTRSWNSIHHTALHQVPGILQQKVNKSDQSSYYLGSASCSDRVPVRPLLHLCYHTQF